MCLPERTLRNDHIKGNLVEGWDGQAFSCLRAHTVSGSARRNQVNSAFVLFVLREEPLERSFPTYVLFVKKEAAGANTESRR